MDEGIPRKISSGKLRGGLRAVWHAAECVYYGLEATVWLIFFGILLFKKASHFLSWLF